MVPKLAQAIASGEVPDLMGIDLIYGPQFEAAGQLEDITDMIKDWPELKTASPGHMKVSTYEGRLYGVPLYADVSVLYWNKRLFKAAGLDPEVGPASARRDPRHVDEDHRRRGRRLRLFPGRQLRRLQHLHLRAADLGHWRHGRAEGRQ